MLNITYRLLDYIKFLVVVVMIEKLKKSNKPPMHMYVQKNIKYAIFKHK